MAVESCVSARVGHHHTTTVLVLNAGSSSLKYNLWSGGAELARGTVDRPGSMSAALETAFAAIGSQAVDAVGHRVVHGGGRFDGPVLVDAAVEQAIDELGVIAPLHNPHSLEGIRAVRARMPKVPQVAVFDTSFHHTLPPEAYAYAVPERLGIRRYGFHGISHQYVSQRYAELAGRSPETLRVITCHLGNGCSVCAVEGGRSVDTSMGFTPMEGLVMGTRCGDIDPGAILHLLSTKQTQVDDLRRILNSESGLLAVSGVSNDMRDVLKAVGDGDLRAELGVALFCYRVKKYIGAYLAAMNGADAVVFTGGIGEHSPEVRLRICSGLDWLGVSLNPAANLAVEGEGRIGFGPVAVWVVPTREEMVIARETASLLAGKK